MTFPLAGNATSEEEEGGTATEEDGAGGETNGCLLAWHVTSLISGDDGRGDLGDYSTEDLGWD